MLLRILLMALACAAGGLWITSDLQAETPAPNAPSTAAAATDPNPMVPVTYRTARVSGQTVGEVLVDNQVVFRLRDTSQANATLRAQVIANRLSNLLAQGYTWRDVTTGTYANMPALYVGNQVLVAASPNDARFNNTSQQALAQSWQNNLVTALAGYAPNPNDENTWPEWTNPETKIVPIVAAGTPGVSLGFAQVTGPAARVNDVRAVLQLDLTFRGAATVAVFVPSSSLTGLNRVQGTAVTALLSYRLIRL